MAQAGTPLQTLQERLGQEGTCSRSISASRGTCSIGGNISTSAGGNRVIRYGMTRDLILGLEVVTADGTVLLGLRKYIKNNTGIDLKQLFIGSEGVLGVLTRAALRIFTAPTERQVALCALSFSARVGGAPGAERLSIVIEKTLQLRIQKTEIRLVRRSAVRSFDSSALQPDLRVLWKTSIFHLKAYHSSFSIGSAREPTGRSVPLDLLSVLRPNALFGMDHRQRQRGIALLLSDRRQDAILRYLISRMA